MNVSQLIEAAIAEAISNDDLMVIERLRSGNRAALSTVLGWDCWSDSGYDLRALQVSVPVVKSKRVKF
jgi:hypothetical protein